jgi:uncharacterized protein YciI
MPCLPLSYAIRAERARFFDVAEPSNGYGGSGIDARARETAVMQFIAITRRLTERFTDTEFAEYLGAEGERARELYAAGSFRALYSRGDVPGAVIEIEAADADEAARLVGSLPFAVRGLMEYRIVPLRPYRVFAGTT